LICPACKKETADGASRCAHCGADLVPPPPTAAAALTATSSVLVTADFSPGTIFHDRYEILAPLGRGGMGMVLKARDRSLDEIVAIKILRPDFAEDQVMAGRFRSEIKVARRIRHRNVCVIHDYGEDEGLLFISMEYVEGTDLKRLLRERGAFAPAEAYEVSIQIAEGLQAVHDAGVIHRDLKTPNIMLDPSGSARLMDFGIAKKQGEGTLTTTGTILGTPEYMSPEQAQGQKIDHRSDLYALGIVIYELFTGQVPFRGETPISTILKQIQETPQLEEAHAARLPPSLRPVLKKALAKDPSQRYGSARELAEALRQASKPSSKQQPIPTAALQAPTMAAPTVVSTTPPRVVPRPQVPRSRSFPVVPVAGGVIGVLGIGALVFWWMGRGGTGPVPGEEGASPSPGATVAAVSMSPTPTPTPLRSQVDQVLLAATATPTPTPRPRRPTPPPPTPRPVRATPKPARATPTPAPATPTPVVARGPGRLKVVVRPWATIYVDGREIGQTPLDAFSVESGSHLVRIRNPLWKAIEKRVVIRPGETKELVFDLPKQGTRNR
jgi:serine/threonine-protein kinase